MPNELLCGTKPIQHYHVMNHDSGLVAYYCDIKYNKFSHSLMLALPSCTVTSLLALQSILITITAIIDQ